MKTNLITAAISGFMRRHLPSFFNQNGSLQSHQTTRPLQTSGKVRRAVLVKNPPKDLNVQDLLDRFAIRR